MSRQAQLGADEVGGLRFWICAVVGLGLVGFGLGGLLTADLLGSASSWAIFFFGGLLVHDLVFAPLVVGASAALLFVTGRRVRPVVQATAIVVGVVTLVSLPVVLGEGRLAGNPSLLPHDYGRNLALVVGAFVVVGVIAGVRAKRRPAAPDSRPSARNHGW